MALEVPGDALQTRLDVVQDIRRHLLRVQHYVVVFKDSRSFMSLLRRLSKRNLCGFKMILSINLFICCIVIIEKSQLIYQAAIVYFALIVHKSTDVFMEKAGIFTFLKVLRNFGSSINYSHKVFNVHYIVAVGVNSQQVDSDIVEILLQEKFPLIHRAEFSCALSFLLNLFSN